MIVEFYGKVNYVVTSEIDDIEKNSRNNLEIEYVDFYIFKKCSFVEAVEYLEKIGKHILSHKIVHKAIYFNVLICKT